MLLVKQRRIIPMNQLLIADRERLGYVGRLPGVSARDSDSWYTPAAYLEAARTALGGAIYLDPYTSDAANQRVGAAVTYTLENPAPAGELWPVGPSCWMNPPYSGALVLTASEQFVSAFQARRFERGIVLVNNATETRFFGLLLRAAAAVCFTDHRISFDSLDGKRISGNTRGQAFFYFDRQRARAKEFAAAFAPFGPVMRCGNSLLKGGR
jgi:hypothetical protein